MKPFRLFYSYSPAAVPFPNLTVGALEETYYLVDSVVPGIAVSSEGKLLAVIKMAGIGRLLQMALGHCKSLFRYAPFNSP